jgi:phosphatidylserine decarboxylase
LNKEDMEKELHEFPTLHELFIRKLKKDVRKIDSKLNSVVSPVDSVIAENGIINESSEMVVKGKIYSVEEMLGDQESVKKYLNGTYIIHYLSPSHYHRIHSPATGKVMRQWTLGSKSYPVNKWGLKYGNKALSKNFRVITEVKTDFGYMAIVKVGAMFINSIEITHAGDQLEKGKEMAYFSFGSTVILLFEKGSFQIDSSIRTPAEIKVGERIGEFQ